MAIARENSRPVPLNAISTGGPAPFLDAAIETPPVMTVDVIRPVSRMSVIVLNHFIFFASRSRTSISLSKYASISVNFFKQYVYGSCGAVGFKFG